jgi:hypothetical protein
MSEHLPVKMDLFEINVREIGHRTKRYLLQEVIMNMIDKYLLYFDELF